LFFAFGLLSIQSKGLFQKGKVEIQKIQRKVDKALFCRRLFGMCPLKAKILQKHTPPTADSFMGNVLQVVLFSTKKINTAAHKSYHLAQKPKVTNEANGKFVVVEIRTVGLCEIKRN
jgi:hypothetical protein